MLTKIISKYFQNGKLYFAAHSLIFCNLGNFQKLEILNFILCDVSVEIKSEHFWDNFLFVLNEIFICCNFDDNEDGRNFSEKLFLITKNLFFFILKNGKIAFLRNIARKLMLQDIIINLLSQKFANFGEKTKEDFLCLILDNFDLFLGENQSNFDYSFAIVFYCLKEYFDVF
ncbi:hypothetical protein MHBO_000238 [Bonamia ostreae]|uniref:Uncharacterized protein n=1 Tax=Bonamia ostreae TaxID=126728 RepID=A0ABV2AEW5_9EUKA